MLVEDLIAQLLLMPPKAKAVVNLTKNELANGCEVRTVLLKTAQRNNSDIMWHENYFPELLNPDIDLVQEQIVDISA